MKLKKLPLLLSWGITAGFILGLIKTLIEIQKQNYLGYKMYLLILNEAAHTINIWTIGAIIALLLTALILGFGRFFGKKVFAPYLDVRLSAKKSLRPLFQGALLGAILIYGIFLALNFFMSESRERLQFLEIIILALLLVIYFLFRKLKLNRSQFNKIFQTTLLKKVAITLALILIIINSLSIAFSLFLVPSGPNVLVIVPDSLRPDHLGCFGYPRFTSPRIDQFADESVVFEKAISNSPWTKPSMGTIFTSLLPFEHQADSWADDLFDKSLTLAEIFRNRNYSTFAVQTNMVISKNHNFDQGFQTFDEINKESAETVTSKFLTWSQKQKKPFFAYLHYMDTHIPYNAPQDFSEIFGLDADADFKPGDFKTLQVRVLTKLGLNEKGKEEIIQLYDGAIKYFDFHFGLILDELKKRGILDNTIIILISDHGEEFWEHGGFAHGHTLYNELLHVVYMIRYPKLLPAKRVSSFAQLTDVYPTLLEIAGIHNYPLTTGTNLLPHVLNDNMDYQPPIFCEAVLFDYEKYSTIWKGWKIIENTNQVPDNALFLYGNITKFIPSIPSEEFELYNMALDFSETNNLAQQNSDQLTILKNRLTLFNIERSKMTTSKQTNLERKREDLKALGYIK